MAAAVLLRFMHLQAAAVAATVMQVLQSLKIHFYSLLWAMEDKGVTRVTLEGMEEKARYLLLTAL